MKEKGSNTPEGAAEGSLKPRNRLVQLLSDRPIPILSLVLLLGFAWVAWYASQLSVKLIESNAITQASRTAQSFAIFRTIYTSDVVNRVQAHGVEIRHDYDKHDGAIPLPATLSIKLGEEIGALGTGLGVSLYSPYPFPWRESQGGLRDEFRRVAWEQLNAAPDQPFYLFEDYKGRASLRYATADRMRQECVQCHNTHPQTPKKGWKEGDVRGVLEVILPLDKIRENMDTGLRNTMGLLSVTALLGVVCLAVAMGQLRAGARRLREQVEARTAALRQSESDKTELMLFRSELELQVENRTAELREKAESDASLAALSSRLQGLTADQIVDAALSSIIENTGAPAGALYVLEKDGRLYRRAEHALPPEAETQSVFPLGSGSIGHAAKVRKMQVLDPGDQEWSVTFGLGRTPPRHIVTCPLVARDNLVGVVELYLLTEFNDTRGQWLTKAAEVTATALRLATEGVDLEQRKEQLRLILETSLDAVVTIREDSTITGWNAQAEATLGYSAEEAIGSKVTELIIPEQYREAHLNGIARFLESGEGPVLGQRVELSALHKDGYEFPIELSISPPIETRSGLEFSAFIRDIRDIRDKK